MPMSRSARRSRVSGNGCRNCQRITSPDDISTTESKPNPTSAIEDAAAPAAIDTTASTPL